MVPYVITINCKLRFSPESSHAYFATGRDLDISVLQDSFSRCKHWCRMVCPTPCKLFLFVLCFGMVFVLCISQSSVLAVRSILTFNFLSCPQRHPVLHGGLHSLTQIKGSCMAPGSYILLRNLQLRWTDLQFQDQEAIPTRVVKLCATEAPLLYTIVTKAFCWASVYAQQRTQLC